MPTKTLIIGASENPDRYAHKAARSLKQHGHPVELIGLRAGTINGTPIQMGQPALTDIDTVTLYVSPRNQHVYADYIKQLKPRRVIFNPGAENPALENELAELGIEPVEACTLVMLSIGNYD